MRQSTSPSALDRLREAFRPPRSFGAVAGPAAGAAGASLSGAEGGALGGLADAPPRSPANAPPSDPASATPHPGVAESLEDGEGTGIDAPWSSGTGRFGRFRVDPGQPGVRVLAL